VVLAAAALQEVLGRDRLDVLAITNLGAAAAVVRADLVMSLLYLLAAGEAEARAFVEILETLAVQETQVMQETRATLAAPLTLQTTLV
jgi:hypothetical protein